jgi:hypothetical protein
VSISRNEAGRRSSAKLLTPEEAFLIAVNIAKLPSVPRQILRGIPRPPNSASRQEARQRRASFVGFRSESRNQEQRTRPQRSRQQRRQCIRPHRSRQQRRHDTSVKSLRLAVTPAGNCAAGAACAVPVDRAAKINPVTAIANAVRMCIFLLYGVILHLVALLIIKFHWRRVRNTIICETLLVNMEVGVSNPSETNGLVDMTRCVRR